MTLYVNAQMNVSCVQARTLENNKNIFNIIFVHAVVRNAILFPAISRSCQSSIEIVDQRFVECIRITSP